MSFTPERYRVVEFVGGRILEARELANVQEFARGIDANNQPTAFLLDGLYREGATINVTASANGATITLVPTDNTLPMFVFVRGQWEQLQTAEAPPITLINPQVDIYLNWEIHQITSADDPSLIDLVTLEPTANMGELRMSVSNTDTSSQPLQTNQYEKNLVPVILFRYTWQGANLAPSPFTAAVDGVSGNVKKPALANSTTAGLVSLTTDTSWGTAVSTDDPRMADERVPLPNSVDDSKVLAPTPTGATNTDGTPTYDLNLETGGISADKIVYEEGTQLVSASLQVLESNLTALTIAFDAHQGAPLGLPNTHPFPTAAQCGAAPASHVGQILGLDTSHPATVGSSTRGFVVIRDPEQPPYDYLAYSLEDGIQTKIAMRHDGDLQSIVSGQYTANPLVESGDGTLASGPLSNLGLIAQVLAQHVNKYPHKNPHGISLSDLGGDGVTQAYVDTHDAMTLASAEAYANALASNAKFSQFYSFSIDGGAGWMQWAEFLFSPNGVQPLRILLGTGVVTTTGNETHYLVNYLPPGAWEGANLFGNMSLQGIPYGPGTISEVTSNYGGGAFTAWQKRYDGSSGYKGPYGVKCSIWAMAWRNS